MSAKKNRQVETAEIPATAPENNGLEADVMQAPEFTAEPKNAQTAAEELPAAETKQTEEPEAAPEEEPSGENAQGSEEELPAEGRGELPAEEEPPAEEQPKSARRMSNFELHSRLRFLAQDFRALKDRKVMKKKLKDLLDEI